MPFDSGVELAFDLPHVGGIAILTKKSYKLHYCVLMVGFDLFILFYESV